MVNRSSPGPFPLALHGDFVGHRSPNEIGPGVYDIHSPRARHAARPTTAAERRPAAGGSALFEILVEINALKHRRDALFARCDVLLMPATAALPWAAEQSHPETTSRPGPPGHAIFTGFANEVGLPTIAMPWGHVDGLPTGFQLAAPAGRDRMLLAHSREFERGYGNGLAASGAWSLSRG